MTILEGCFSNLLRNYSEALASNMADPKFDPQYFIWSLEHPQE